MTNCGISSSFPVYADASFALEVWVPCAVKPGSQDFLSNITVWVLVSSGFVSSVFSYCSLLWAPAVTTLFHLCILTFSSFVSEEYTSGHVKTSTRGLLTFYLQVSRICGSHTWRLHTWAHVSTVFSFNHPCCCTTVLFCLLLRHHDTTTVGLERRKTSGRSEPSRVRQMSAVWAVFRL